MQLKVATGMFTLTLLGSAALAAAQPPPDPAELPGWWFVGSFQTAGAHERNTVGSGDSRTDDSFLRLTPTVETRFRDARRKLNLLYTFDSETHPAPLQALTDVLARQLATAAYDSSLGERTRFTGRAQYLATRRPDEVLEEVGLVPGRRRTLTYQGDAAIDHDLTPSVRLSVGYNVGFEDYGAPTEIRPGARTTMHSGRASVSLQHSPRTAWAIEYSGSFLNGEDLTLEERVRDTFTAHMVGLRLTRNLTPRLTLVLHGGPRLSEALASSGPPVANAQKVWDIRPDLLASLTYRKEERRFGVAYTRTQFRGLGAEGFINTESIELRAGYDSHRRLRLSARPGLYRNTRLNQRTLSYRLDVAAQYPIMQWLSIDAAYLLKRQDRPLFLDDVSAGPGRERSRNSIVVGLTLRRPVRMD
jgi:hypothetical protein